MRRNEEKDNKEIPPKLDVGANEIVKNVVLLLNLFVGYRVTVMFRSVCRLLAEPVSS